MTLFTDNPFEKMMIQRPIFSISKKLSRTLNMASINQPNI